MKNNSENQARDLLKIFVLGVFLLIATSCINSNRHKIPKIVDGTLDLTNWNFEKQGTINLNGNWKFFWNSFLMDSICPAVQDSGYMNVPGLWNNQNISTIALPSHGFASYKLNVILPNNNEMALKYYNSATSCELFINGKSYFASGKPGMIKTSTIPSYQPAVVNFTPINQRAEIILHIANYHHRKAGQWEPIILGESMQVANTHNRTLFVELLLIGSIFIMALFHLAIYFLHSDEKPSLYFGIFSFLISLRFIASGEFTIYLLGDFNWNLVILADYLSFYLAILFFLLFMKSLYPNEVNPVIAKLILFVTIVYSIATILLPPNIYTYGMVYFQLFTITGAIYGFYALYKALKNKREGIKFFILGFGVLFICVVNDILLENEIITSVALAPFGLTFFILSKAFVLSSRIRYSLEHNKILTTSLAIQNEEYVFLNNEFKQQNEKLILAKEKAEESDRFKSAFLANISHEIRTPMNGIIGFADLLNKDDISEDKRKKYLSILKERGKYLLGVVNDIIDISRIETGQVEMRTVNCNINILINELFNAYYQITVQKGVTLVQQSTLPNELAIMSLDTIKLRQVLENLLSNAIKFTSKGKIEFGYLFNENQLEFFVSDTGIGISESEKEIIFDRFNQANLSISQKYGGTGLGLAIVKAYVKLLGGEIKVDSAKGEGSRFSFRLSYHPIYEQNKSNMETSNLEQTKSRLNILLVEDNMANAFLIEEILSEENIDLTHAADGEEAVSHYTKNPKIQLVLMDIKLPDTNGYDLTKTLLSIRPNVPVIAQTAFALKGDREKALEAGCIDYISKPIDAKELITKINQYAAANQ